MCAALAGAEHHCHCVLGVCQAGICCQLEPARGLRQALAYSQAGLIKPG